MISRSLCKTTMFSYRELNCKLGPELTRRSRRKTKVTERRRDKDRRARPRGFLLSTATIRGNYRYFLSFTEPSRRPLSFSPLVTSVTFVLTPGELQLQSPHMSPKKVAVVTGSSSGFGLLTVVELAKAGFLVVATMRQPERRARLDQALSGNLAAKVEVRQLDVTNFDGIPATIEQIAGSW